TSRGKGRECRTVIGHGGLSEKVHRENRDHDTEQKNKDAPSENLVRGRTRTGPVRRDAVFGTAIVTTQPVRDTHGTERYQGNVTETTNGTRTRFHVFIPLLSKDPCTIVA